MEINDKPLMASEIIGALVQPKRTIAHFKSGSIAEGKARETQSMLVNAQKFKVSNKLIDHAGEASMSKPHVLLEMIHIPLILVVCPLVHHYLDQLKSKMILILNIKQRMNST